MSNDTYLLIDDGFNAWTQDNISDADRKAWVDGVCSIFKITVGPAYPLVFQDASLDDTPDWVELMQQESAG